MINPRDIEDELHINEDAVDELDDGRDPSEIDTIVESV